MQIVSLGDILPEISHPIFWEKIGRKYFTILSTEMFTQHTKCFSITPDMWIMWHILSKLLYFVILSIGTDKPRQIV